jgi:hypothetical protein
MGVLVVTGSGWSTQATKRRDSMGYYTSYSAFALPLFLVIVVSLYILLTGSCELSYRER